LGKKICTFIPKPVYNLNKRLQCRMPIMESKGTRNLGYTHFRWLSQKAKILFPTHRRWAWWNFSPKLPSLYRRNSSRRIYLVRFIWAACYGSLGCWSLSCSSCARASRPANWAVFRHGSVRRQFKAEKSLYSSESSRRINCYQKSQRPALAVLFPYHSYA